LRDLQRRSESRSNTTGRSVPIVLIDAKTQIGRASQVNVRYAPIVGHACFVVSRTKDYDSN